MTAGVDTSVSRGRLGHALTARRMEASAAVLMFSSLATGALGILYWAVAEHLFPTEAVGRAAALTSTATMLSSLACLSLGGSYQRFLPIAGRHARRLVVGGLATVAVAGAILGAAFVLSGVETSRLFEHPAERVLFPVGVVVLALYALLDPILIGLQRSPAVAVKNTALSVLKILPLPFFAASGSAATITGSWGALCVVVVMAAFGYVLRRGLISHDGRPSALPPIRELWAFQSSTFVLMVVLTLTPLCLPLIVLSELGARHAAYYNLVAALATAASMLRSSVLSSYVVEASAPGADRAALTRRMLKLMTVVGIAGAIGLAVLGPVLLLIVSKAYADAATGLVLLLAVETVVAIGTATYAAVAQVLRRLPLFIVSQSSIVAVTLGGSVLLGRTEGLLGIGIATLAGQVVAMAMVAVSLRRMLVELCRTPTAGDGA